MVIDWDDICIGELGLAVAGQEIIVDGDLHKVIIKKVPE